jgi:hypothetical protein
MKASINFIPNNIIVGVFWKREKLKGNHSDLIYTIQGLYIYPFPCILVSVSWVVDVTVE